MQVGEAINVWLIRAQKPISERIACKGQAHTPPPALTTRAPCRYGTLDFSLKVPKPEAFASRARKE